MPHSSPTRWRLGIDVGGTFTDFIAVPTEGDVSSLAGAIRHKSPSTPDDPARAVEVGLRDLQKLGVAVDDVISVTHGTTIGLNAILQGKGATVALVTSTGHRDMLGIGRARLPRSFDLHTAPPRSPVPRQRVVEFDGRFTPDGARAGVGADAADDEAGYRETRDRLRHIDAAAVAVSLVGGYAAVSDEVELARRLQLDLGVPVTSAASVWPQAGEYERTTLAILNAQIAPLMESYFGRLSEVLAVLGLRAPLFISTSNGGSMSLDSARERPIDTVLSGPASGVSATARLWPDENIVTIDMGGTSSDIGILRGGQPTLTTTAMIGDLPLITPVVEVTAIGAGGGSIVWADHQAEQPVLRVGPRSAGAVPGPAAYDRGGTEATLTDAFVHAGIIDPEAFLGGEMPLSASRAATALADTWQEVGLEGSGDAATDAAESTLRIASAGMSTRLRTVLARHGESPDRFTFVAFGGAGGIQGALLADEVGARNVIVPAAAATFCALGAAITPVRRDLVRTISGPIDPARIDEIGALFDDMAGEARAWFADQASQSNATFELSADLKYAQQPSVIEVALARTGSDIDTLADVLDASTARERFDQAHRKQHGFVDAEAVLEVEALRLTIVGEELEVQVTGPDAPLRRTGLRRVRFGSQWLESQVLVPGSADDGGLGENVVPQDTDDVPGPAIVEREDTSVLIPPGWSVRSDPAGNLHLTRTGARQEETDDLIA